MSETGEKIKMLEKTSPEKKIKKEKSLLECICGKKYKNKSSYNNHQKIKHFKDDENLNKKIEKNFIKVNEENLKIFNKDFKNFIKMLSNVNKEELVINSDFINFKNIFKEKKYYEKIEKEYFEIKNKYKIQTQVILEILKKNFFVEYVNKKKNFNIYEIFGLFLFYISEFVDENIFYNILFVLTTFSICLNQKGNFEKNKNENKNFEKEKNKNFNYCEISNGEDSPFFLNIYLLDYFQYCLLNLKLLVNDFNLDFFGVEPIKMMKLILFMKFFCNWLFINSFTSKEIDLINNF